MTPMQPPTTARLRLRPIVLEDAPFILGLLNEPSFLEHIGDKGARDVEGARRYLTDGPLAMYATHGLGLWLVALQDGTPIGMCGMLQRPTLADPDLGFAFVPRYWGQGYAFEACQATLDWAREVRGFERVIAIVSPGNAASISLLQKLGLRPEGRITMTPGDEVLLYALGATASGATASGSTPAPQAR